MEQDTPDLILIEDNSYDTEFIIMTLKSKNIIINDEKMLVLNNGEDALNYFFCKKKYSARDIKDLPKLIILDNKLPKYTGLEVIKKIKEDKRTSKVPIVMLSSSQEGKDISESYRLGVNSYVVKPIDYNKFTEVIYQIGYYWLILNEVL